MELTVSATLRDFILISAAAVQPTSIPRIIQFPPSKDALSIALRLLERTVRSTDVSIDLIELIPAPRFVPRLRIILYSVTFIRST